MKDPNALFSEMLKGKATTLDEWTRARFEKFKRIAATEKGDLGEDFLAALLRECGYRDVVRVKSRRGHFDVSVGDKYKFEVKTASLDTNRSFQFNGVRYDTKYTHLFCLGIAPNSLHFLIVPKKSLHDYSLTPMAKGVNSSFKLPRPLEDTQPIERFGEVIGELIPLR